MFTQNGTRYIATAFAMSIGIIVVLACSKGPRVDRVSIMPAVSPGQTAERIDVTSSTSPTQLSPGQQAELSVDLTQSGSGLRVQWRAPQNKGYFIRPTDSLSTVFVAPNEPGLVDIACNIESNGETRIVHVPINVLNQPSAPSTSVTNVTPSSSSQTGSMDIESATYVPCGWMGDGEEGERYLRVQNVNEKTQFGSSYSKWSFRPGGKKGWLAVGWQLGDCNWGDSKGLDLKARGFKRVSIWAKGLPDSENKLPVIQFKAGGNTAPTKKYQASFSVASEFLTLSPDWQQYHLDLQNEDLSSVISAFTFVLRTKDNPNGATFLVGSITYNNGR